MPKLLFQRHGSYRLTADDNRVIYVDPYKGKGYDVPADIILVTHQHRDHNQVGRCAKKPDCRILVHLKPGESFRKKSEQWEAPNKLLIEPGQEINL